ncbi:TPA: hypothetical protein PXN30_004087 [Yersinia enterocolitica]|uniref:hypothetical protein n=1 Tax=Yersinia TaxID=629 RepID=UPI000AEAD842|nr:MULTISPECIES: hypothetical protein [Yersinia]EKN3682201.1 hypothetical protein [Yersinia enterocolitica]EKN4830606.1 hypothetical protein [Yersinia enterocolitica]EKN4853962.1 hypothetical protein [Yersinia enterocolitica]ELW8176982.1 hypothetical protein [Yersinia enterocolitica]HDL7180283.1 hypothetical protein [Yersinia enterocolitica]
MNGTYFSDYGLRFLVLKSGDNLTCMINFNFSGETNFPECVLQQVIVLYNHEVLHGILTCFPLTLLAASPLFLWINPSLTGTSPVQQSDCRQQSQRAACSSVFLPCVNTLPMQRLIHKFYIQTGLFVFLVGFIFILIKK